MSENLWISQKVLAAGSTLENQMIYRWVFKPRRSQKMTRVCSFKVVHLARAKSECFWCAAESKAALGVCQSRVTEGDERSELALDGQTLRCYPGVHFHEHTRVISG